MHILEPQRLEHHGKTRGRPLEQRGDRRLLIDRMGEIENLELRLKLLSEKDRQLILLLLTGVLSRRQVCAAMNMSVASVSRSLRRIVNQLHDPLVTMLIDPACTLSPEYKALAILYFIHRVPMSAIAKRQEMTLYDVRTGLEYVRGWCRGATSKR